jgi:hypothetical protein
MTRQGERDSRTDDSGRRLVDGGAETGLDAEPRPADRTDSLFWSVFTLVRGETSHIELSTRLASLDAELTVLGSRLDQSRSATAETDDPAPARAYLTAAQELVSDARSLLVRGHIEEAWGRYHGARRLTVFVTEAVGDTDSLTTQARTVYEDALGTLAANRRRAVVALLTDGSTLKTPPTADELAESMRVLHQQYERLLLRRRYLQSQFNQLLVQGTVSLLVLLAVAFAAELGLSPILVRPLTTTNLTSVGFALYVVLVGVIGASLFGMRSLRNLPLSAQTTNQVPGLFVTGARVFIGASSALILVFVLFTGLLPIQEAVTAPLALAVAFAGGYSERLAPQTVEVVSQVIPMSEPGDGQQAVTPIDD